MTVKVREWKKNNKVGFEVDIRFTYPDGTPFRRRTKAPVESKSAAKRWGEATERELLVLPTPTFLKKQEEERKEVPTLADFGTRFIDEHARANQQKASSIRAKELILKNHLYPALGEKRLDAISDADVQKVKANLSKRGFSAKTINNVLTVLTKLLRVAAKWKVIASVPCSVELLRVSNRVVVFYEFDEYKRLVEAARALGTRWECAVLLGGDAGLRGGEMIALTWANVDFRRGQLRIEQQMWRRIVDAPKSGRGRIVSMTNALRDGLKRHQRTSSGEHVFCTSRGLPLAYRTLWKQFRRVQARADIRVVKGNLHVLRHTFCSHLAMKGAPARAIQELAGHLHLSTTERYMHLSPQARDGAIRLLNARHVEAANFGDIVETGT